MVILIGVISKFDRRGWRMCQLMLANEVLGIFLGPLDHQNQEHLGICPQAAHALVDHIL